MQYFGEQFPPYCGSCDYCQSSLEERDATVNAQKLLSAIVRTGERFGGGYIIDFLRGSASEKINPVHKELKTYGIGKDVKKEEWQWLLQQLLQHQYLAKTEEQFATIHLTPKGWKVLRGESIIKLLIKKEKIAAEKTAELGYDKQLFTVLKTLRADMADMEHVPAYAIVADNTLMELVTYLPLELNHLKHISGFGDYKISKYGATFLHAIKEFAAQNGLETRITQKQPKREKKPTTTDNQGANSSQMASLTLFKEGLDIAGIATARGLSVGTIETHLSGFIATGQVEISKLLPAAKIKAITEAVANSGQHSAMKPVKDLLGDDITYGEIRLVLEHLKAERSKP